MNFILDIPLRMYAFAALGAFVLWLRLRYGNDLQRAISEIVDDILGGYNGRTLIKILLYVGIGATVGVVLASPASARQALAAGLGWTGLMGSIGPARPKKSNAKGSASETSKGGEGEKG